MVCNEKIKGSFFFGPRFKQQFLHKVHSILQDKQQIQKLAGRQEQVDLLGSVILVSEEQIKQLDLSFQQIMIVR